jgi:phosphoglycolate phosphatase-like HAD superfamily hydrolase
VTKTPGDNPRIPDLKAGWKSAEQCSVPQAERSAYSSPGFDWRSFDAYLFDIDGTLLNSRDAVHYFAFHSAVRRILGREFSVEGIPVHGNTDIGILRAYMKAGNVPESEWLPRVSDLVAFMADEVERNAGDLRPELCPSILGLVERLHAAGKLLGVASGNLERVGWAKLRAAKLDRYFRFGAFSDTRELRDHIIAFGVEQAREILGSNEVRVVVVGDTPADISSAHANGIPVIAVATGIYSFEELIEHRPEMCVPCCDELLA